MSEEQVVEQTEAQVATEKEARLLGWVPQGEYKDGDHFVDAEAFVKRGKEINPILRKNNETLLKKLEAANFEIAEVKKVAKEFEKFQKDNAEKRVKELQQELVDLKEKKKDAVSQGDGAAVVALDDAIDAVKEQQQEAKVVPKVEAKPVVHVPATLDPVITGWMEENAWFTADEKLTRIADTIGARINEQHPELSGKAFFDELDKELAEILPERLKKKARSSPVEGATQSNRPTGSKKQSYDNLPADAKEACNRFVKQGLMTKEQYVSEYDFS
jgi:hypothetical protein